MPVTKGKPTAGSNGISLFVKAGIVLAVLSVIAAGSSALGTRFEIWDFTHGILIFKGSVIAAALAVTLSFIGLFTTFRIVLLRGFRIAVAALIIAGILVTAGWLLHKKTITLPDIHDISTDTQNPPLFKSLLPLRRKATNPPEYSGAETARKQASAYPYVTSLILKADPAGAFEKALSVARDMGWKIIDARKDEGRIEAVDTTFWFGCRDDIVIRITPTDSGSRIDIRSASRVGSSDFGGNARRIREFLSKTGKPSS